MTAWVRFDSRSIEECREVARRRNRPGLTDRHGYSGDGEDIHLLGVLGEAAVASALGRDFNPTVDTFKSAPDLPGCEVRTRSKRAYELLVRPDDPDEIPFVLVSGEEAPVWLEVIGWLRGREAKRGEWLRRHGGRPPAYFVPHHELRPIRRG